MLPDGNTAIRLDNDGVDQSLTSPMSLRAKCSAGKGLLTTCEFLVTLHSTVRVAIFSSLICMLLQLDQSSTLLDMVTLNATTARSGH